ncbi:MAG: peptidylprolyl isomerase [Sedimentisphaerales bacterium]|nr:peptidylprolyl isomerase [Sedimentisphaerales bacterium]
MEKAKSGDTVVIHYTGKLDDGSIFETSEDQEPLLLTIGENDTIQVLEEAIVGMKPGDTKTLKIPAADAYGPYNKKLVKTVSRSVLVKGIEPKIGQELQATRMDGRKVTVTVKEITDKSVTFDENHPLAGQDLTFDVQLMEIV